MRCTVLAFFSARSTSGISGSSASCTLAGAAASVPSPVFRSRTSCAITSVLSRTSGKAAGLPIRACDTDLARRCDCISAWPVAPTWAEPRLAAFSEVIVTATTPMKPSSTRPPRMRCCSPSGRSPISGRPLPAAAASASPARRTSENSAISDGAASVMMDESICAVCCIEPRSSATVPPEPGSAMSFASWRPGASSYRSCSRVSMSPALSLRPSPLNLFRKLMCSSCGLVVPDQPTILRKASSPASAARLSSCHCRPEPSR